MTTIGEILYQAASRLPGVVSGRASATTTTTLTDALNLARYDDDEWNGGAVVLPDVPGWSVVTDFDGAGIVTWADSMGGGLRYALVPAAWSPGQMLAGLDEGLLAAIRIRTQTATIAGDGETRQFTMATWGLPYEPRRIHFIRDMDAADDEAAWVEWFGWRQDGETLIFVEPPPDGWTGRVEYADAHAIFDTIDPPPEMDLLQYELPDVAGLDGYLVWCAVSATLRNQIGRTGYDEGRVEDMVNLALEERERAFERLSLHLNDSTWPREVLRV